MTSRVEPEWSHPSVEDSQGQRVHRSSGSLGVVLRDEKPIPLHIISSKIYPSESELEDGMKDCRSSVDRYTLESEAPLESKP